MLSVFLTAWNNIMKYKKMGALTRLTAFFAAAVLSVSMGTGRVCAADIYRVSSGDIANLSLIPGGMPFGVQLMSDGVVVVGVGDVKSGGRSVSPARDAGIAEHDVIIKINGKKISGVAELADTVNECGGSAVELVVRRGEGELTFKVTPVICDEDGRYRVGLLIRDGTAGIGTVTYIDPKTGSFAGLGHGICDIDTGEIVPVTRGCVVNVEISGVVRGKPGSPGELQGYFSSGKVGTLFDNKNCGVFGVFCSIPKNTACSAVPVAASEEVCDGDAEILCTVGNDGIGRYKVRLSNVDRTGKGVKNFVVTVTDPALIERTGGIVQGMSGSPIIQNGKLVGAVTHVLVNEPCRGYGIFITNMLKEAEKIK